MKSSLEHLDDLFRLLKLLNIEEPPELAAAREVIKELICASETYAVAMAEIQRRVQAMQVQCPVPTLPAPDPAVAKAVEAAQRAIAESLQPKAGWDEKFDWGKAAIN